MIIDTNSEHIYLKESEKEEKNPTVLGNSFFLKKIYLFIFGCIGSSLLHVGFL